MSAKFDATQDAYRTLGYLLAEQSKNVVFVVGAGMSVEAGLPMWAGLVRSLTDRACSMVDEPESDQRKAELDAIDDPWRKMDKIHRLLGHRVFVESVQALLGSSRGVPRGYKTLWELNPSGFISLNLDPLLKRAAPTLAREQFATTTDRDRYQRFLLLSQPFVFQPHGDVGRAETWVLGNRRRVDVLKDRAYLDFVKAVLQSKRLVFVGINPTDSAVEFLLLEDFRTSMTTRGIEHFWIRTNPSESDRDWADTYGIRVIEYEAPNHDHSALQEALSGLLAFSPRQSHFRGGYVGETLDPTDLPSDRELRTEEPEIIRRRLNAAIAFMEGKAADERRGFDEALSLVKKYSGSVHMAWHVAPEPGYRSIWGYELESDEPLGDGAFANVWAVLDTDGRKYAIKILKEEILKNRDFLMAFRRGTTAMKYLAESSVDGIVRIVRAFDVPAAIVMEYVDGVTLEDAVANKYIEHLSEGLHYLAKVGDILHETHNLDRQVRHRDLKPANVMIRDWFDPNQDSEVVILDFDLSWYEGAIGKSVIASSKLHNYVAPEQAVKHPKYSSRHTAVDVFGFGMLTYFVVSGKHPTINFHETVDFLQQMESKFVAKSWPDADSSVLHYLAAVVADCCRTSQPLRPSLPAHVSRLRAAEVAIRDQTVPCPSDLLLFFLDSRFRGEPTWTGADGYLLSPEREYRSGPAILRVASNSHQNTPRLEAQLTATSMGNQDRSNVAKYFKRRADQAVSVGVVAGLLDGRVVSADNNLVVVRFVTTRPELSWDQAELVCNGLWSAAQKLAF